MKISVIGCGYLGAVHAAAMAELGHDVVGIDVDERKIDALASGQAPFFEPGLPEILTSASASGRLTFSTDMAAVKGATVHFVAVGTPQKPGSYSADMTYVDAAVDGLLPYLQDGDLVVGKSTVPVGTASRLAAKVKDSAPGANLAWNPEFLREGFAVQDTISPDRLVYGVSPDPEVAGKSRALLNEVYAKALNEQTPLVVTDYATAELVKVSANAFLATKISFINAIAEIAEVTGGNVTELADAIGFDTRIGRRFLNAGIGFGGGCLPKDIRAFGARAEELGRGESLAFLKEVDAINLRRRQHVVDLVVEMLGGKAFEKRVAVLGLAFKPESDDIRDSPSLDIAVQLNGLGAIVRATDPEAIQNAHAKHPQLHFVDTVAEAVEDAEIVLLLTEWKEYRSILPQQIEGLVAGKQIIDGRNVLDSAQWRDAGWTYRAMGRP
ncbi:UDP-glucose/GDP-mannose dehydrogenase family protein [Herbiconiux sp. KACC 21604]|uniref:UDP-glucose dehydrogenase family protein n=1 Tax=unclassified Herbiconiux TaxID=2618217 RepID=UPI00149265A6|nr:UDP-glucose/GDP-mannose dehydrogenase family protein [Herbiconiux sp. SALV-R1]QJU56097.1 UDP-glucose/GDP-mannose dehydrogenase family protein [Herbiconiux sp. SALV-R1]WPO88734.1 UDP-glucose/GDP-mannose dehydrogenase family protein [Herbiconiux sp. KACC 21604]